MKLETAKRLHDARLACDEVQAFCAGVSKEAFLTDRGLKLIVQKLIEIVGEALRQAYVMEPDVVDRIPDIRRIVDTRNRIVLGYDSVDFGLLWDIVQHRMPALERAISGVLDTEPMGRQRGSLAGAMTPQTPPSSMVQSPCSTDAPARTHRERVDP